MARVVFGEVVHNEGGRRHLEEPASRPLALANRRPLGPVIFSGTISATKSFSRAGD